MSCECLMLENGELDCNYTSDFTSIMSSTSEIAFTTLPTIPEISSTIVSDSMTEMTTDDSVIDNYETTTVLTSTVELTTSESLTSESYVDSTIPNRITSTMETTSDVTQFSNVGSTTADTTEFEKVSTATYETTSTSSVTSDFTYKSTTDYNVIVDDTTVSNSFFTDYPTMKTSTESPVVVDRGETTTVDAQQSSTTTETTSEYPIPSTTEVDRNMSTIKPIPCSKVCQNGGTCVSTPGGGDEVIV